jgi:hypothetical protein
MVDDLVLIHFRACVEPNHNRIANTLNFLDTVKILPTARVHKNVSCTGSLFNVKERKIYFAPLIIVIEIDYTGYISVYVTATNLGSVNILPVNVRPIVSSVRVVKKIDRVCDTLYAILMFYKLLTAFYKLYDIIGKVCIVYEVSSADGWIMNSNITVIDYASYCGLRRLCFLRRIQ